VVGVDAMPTKVRLPREETADDLTRSVE